MLFQCFSQPTSWRSNHLWSRLFWVGLTVPLSALVPWAAFGAPEPTRIEPEQIEAETRQSAYILGAGDQIEVTVFGYDEYTGPRVVLPDGTITVPLAGTIVAAGKTTDRLAQELTTRLDPFLVEPVVTVSLGTLRPVMVNVAGEVLRPGPLQLPSLTANEDSVEPTTTPTLSVALTQAGGITQFADILQVVVNRRRPDGREQSTTLNLWEAIGSENAPPDLILQDGDSIYVPRLQPGDETLDRRLVAQSSFAPATVRVRVVGEVTNPGEVQVPPNSSLSSAVATAGGPTADARLSEVAFIRLSENGQIERQELDLSNLSDRYQVQDGDVIIVPKKGSSSLLDFAGRLFNPLGILLNLFN